MAATCVALARCARHARWSVGRISVELFPSTTIEPSVPPKAGVETAIDHVVVMALDLLSHRILDFSQGLEDA